MSKEKLDAVSLAEIDEGVFKYVLIKVYAQDSDGQEIHKLIVRGFQRAEWHADIYDEVSASLSCLGLETECLGGGRISHNPNEKKIFIYGYSQGFGKADHEISKKILLSAYPNYNVSWSNDGY